MSTLLEALVNLEGAIRAKIESSKPSGLIECIAAGGLPLDELPIIDENDLSTPENHARLLADALYKQTRREEFFAQLDNKNLIYSQNLKELFDKYVENWFLQVSALIESYDINSSVADKYMDILESKRTASIQRNKWGDEDRSKWITTLYDFADEKLLHFDAPIFELLPIELQTHFADTGTRDLMRRFAYLYIEPQLNQRTKLNLTKNRSTHEIGCEFEEQIRREIEAAVPHADVSMTKGSGDQGADLIVTIGTTRIVVQAKRYSGTVGNSAVQEVHAAKGYYGAHMAIVVSTGSFSNSARELAAELQVALMDFDAVARTFRQAFSD